MKNHSRKIMEYREIAREKLKNITKIIRGLANIPLNLEAFMLPVTSEKHPSRPRKE